MQDTPPRKEPETRCPVCNYRLEGIEEALRRKNSEITQLNALLAEKEALIKDANGTIEMLIEKIESVKMRLPV